MIDAKFILSKKKLLEQVEKLKGLNLKISYSYKTNREVGNVLQDISDIDFSIHTKEEINMITDKNKIWFFTQAESEDELRTILNQGIHKFVIDNEIDLERLLNVIKGVKINIDLSLRMKFKEHRIGTGKYFVYGMSANKINELIPIIKNNPYIKLLGIHIHRKSQNTSEWEIKSEIKDSINEDNLTKINFLNLGGGLPTEYRSYSLNILNYIFDKIQEARNFLGEYDIDTYIEPGRFFAAPCIKLETEIIQIQDNNIIINTTLYNCALDTFFTGTKMLIEGETEKEKEGGEDYLIKGNSPTRDDIFRYKVRLNNPRVGDKIIFLNAGAYNYTTDFFGYRKLATEIKEDF